MASKQESKPKIVVYAYLATDAVAPSLKSSLDGDAYQLEIFLTHSDFIEAIEACRNGIDCLILDAQGKLPSALGELRSRSILLPTILIRDRRLEDEAIAEQADSPDKFGYYTAIYWLEFQQLNQLPSHIDRVINQFLKIPLSGETEQPSHNDIDKQEHALLACQQDRLAEKLKERLGYLSVYYKRDPERFLRYLPSEEKQRQLAQLKRSYQEIILNYFTDDPLLNQKIDNYVNSAFFADVPIVQVVEIHMDLMDAFSKQLKIEGRSEEILLDYRLTLIDTLSNLCEMYRRSIPRQA